MTVFARDPRKAEAFANEFEIAIKPMTEQAAVAYDFDIVVDSTSLGMTSENGSLFTADQLSGIKFVYDLVTKLEDTPLIREAKKAGIPSLGGLEMLIAQGAKQFEILNGREAPVDIMRNSLISLMEA